MRSFPSSSPVIAFAAVALLGCGDDKPRQPRDTAADDVAPADTTPDDTTPGPDADDEDGTDDIAGEDVAADGTSDATPAETWFSNCNSLFAVRIAEIQRELDATFPYSCDAPLTRDVGRLKTGGKALCESGESPNACRERLYETPPAMADLDAACAGAGARDGCMLGSFLPRCADGTDTCSTDEVVCWDGMRPMVYAEGATNGPSDVWWFHMGGEGGPCQGSTCWGTYRYGENAFRLAMSTLYPDAPASAASLQNGVMSGTVMPYAGINRVRFERCTDAVSDAVEEIDVADGIPAEFLDMYPGAPVATMFSRATVWHKGFNTWRAAFRTMATTAGRDRDGDGTPDMPSLADARLVIISGSSDASMWVTFAADRLAEEIRAIAGNDVDVRMAIDGMFPPMLDNEARYHPDVPADFDMFSMPYGETGLCQLDDNGDGIDNEGCSNATYSEGGTLRTGHEARGVLLDASCEAFHGVKAPACFDRNHTMLHHLDVPIFVLADQEDNTVSDSGPNYAHDRSWLFETPDVFRKRIVDQGWDIVDHWGTSAREEGAGAANGFVLVLPKARRNDEPWGRATHVRFGNDDRMADPMTYCNSDGTKISTTSFNQMFAAWINDSLPRTYAIEDAARPETDGKYWVTGANCRPAE
jgi:hypothetical protein